MLFRSIIHGYDDDSLRQYTLPIRLKRSTTFDDKEKETNGESLCFQTYTLRGAIRSHCFCQVEASVGCNPINTVIQAVIPALIALVSSCADLGERGYGKG